MLIFLLVCSLALSLLWLPGRAAQRLITSYTELMAAVSQAKDGDVLLVGDIDFSPLSPDVPNSMMFITLDKSLTIRSGKPGTAVFLNGGFVLSGSKVAGEKISVTFENIVFDGKADYENLTEADYQYPWNEAEQVYTYNAALKAQQALSFKGNVDACFTGCTFRNYMHEYGPVIDIRYGDYTDNEYLSQIFPDYSGCRLLICMKDSRIENNTALYDGGAIYMEGNQNVVFRAESCVFSGNRSTNGEYSRGGGAIFGSGVALELIGCTLEKNTANHCFVDTLLPEMDTHKGGAVMLEGSKLTMVNSVIRENRASMGGGLSMTNVKADLDGCRFLDNRAEFYATNPYGVVGPWSNMGQGGGMYVEGNSNDTIQLLNCELRSNSATTAYGGIYGYYVPFEDPSFGTYILRLDLCTYADNRADMVYDYTTVEDLLWLSHPGDLFANPHMTLLGCYVVEETLRADFPRHELPSAGNGYSYLSSQSDEAVLSQTIPFPEGLLDRYNGRLTEVTVGSNYSDQLYREPEPVPPATEPPATEPTSPPDTIPLPVEPEKPGSGWIWWLLGGLLVAASGGVTWMHLRRKNQNLPVSQPEQIPVPEKTPIPEPKIVMSRYDDRQIQTILSRIPETQKLTGRELEVLQEILKGRKQGEVAYYLGIEVSTVKDFYRKIYGKLGVPNKDGIFALADEALHKE